MTKFTDQEWEEYLKDHQPEFEGDPDHLRILLEKSMVDWNMYRMRNDSFEPNLAYVKLELPQIIGTALYTVEANNKRPYCNLNNYNLQKANLAGANLFGVSLKKAVLAFSILKGASLTKTDLSDAVLSYADLRGAWLFDTNFRNANLVCAKIQNVRLSRTDFTNTMVSGIQYHNEIKIFGLVVWHKKSIDSFGSSILHSCLGNDMFKRFGLDQEFLESFKGSQPSWFYKPLYYLWKISSNCGQSMLTWILWSIVLAIYFSLNFYWMGSEWFSIKDNGLTEYSFNTFLYYSVATFTTLGFGDIIPKTPEAARWVMAEVITGYIMLGGLISIFATKLARRS